MHHGFVQKAPIFPFILFQQMDDQLLLLPIKIQINCDKRNCYFFSFSFQDNVEEKQFKVIKKKDMIEIFICSKVWKDKLFL